MAELPSAPGAAGRTLRTAGQGSLAYVFVDLWRNFGWLGASGWSPEQAASLMVFLTVVFSGLQNLVSYVRSKQFATELLELRNALDRKDNVLSNGTQSNVTIVTLPKEEQGNG